jgi:glucose/arabinose dehydrogenase
MRLSLLQAVTFAGASAVLFGAAPISCSSDSSSDAANGGEGGSSGDDGTGEAGGGDDTGSPPGDGAAFDVNQFPLAQGDPCRGTAVPADQAYVPQGMCTSLVATVGGLRQIGFAPNGDLFGTSNDGTIHVLHDANGDGVFQSGEVSTFGSTGGAGSDAHVDAAGGFVYAGGPDSVKRWAYTPGATTGGTSQDVVTGIPSGGNHPLHTVHVYDGYLYVHSGSSGNASLSNGGTDYDTSRSLVKRFALASFAPGTPFPWSAGEVVTVGLRNMVGFTRNAITGRMFGVVNGLDDVHYGGVDVHQDNPGEQVLELGVGKKYGYPFCFTTESVTGKAPGTQLFNQDFGVHDDTWCSQNSMPPATFVQAHSAPLDIAFFDAQPRGVLPEKWRGGAFIAFHGSWDRSNATGYKVVWMPFDASGAPPMPTANGAGVTFPYEVVFGGVSGGNPKDGPWTWSTANAGESPRPTGVAVSPIDGALYIASDKSGNLYRLGIKK